MSRATAARPRVASRDEWQAARAAYAFQGPETFGPSAFLPYGRQEDWEDSPEGWPKTPRYTWWRHHDRYEA